MNNQFDTEEQLLDFSRRVIGKPLEEIDKQNRLGIGKGSIGQVVEESHFGYKVNSDARPDFENLGIELKVTPYICKNGKYKSKERLVLNIINYMEEYKKSFLTSSFYEKNSKMLLMFYEHLYDTSKSLYTINYVGLHSFPADDLIIIQQDWEKIVRKIRDGKAHEISEGDTLYLGACTKGVNASSTRRQPFSCFPAMQRAFSLKQSYMTFVLNRMVESQQGKMNLPENMESLNIAPKIKKQSVIKDHTVLVAMGFEGYIEEKLSPYFGRSQKSLALEFGVEVKAKSLNQLLLGKMLGISGRISESDEFIKGDIVPKTVRIEANGQIRESMSFPTFKYTEIVNQEWEESYMYKLFSTTKFMLIVFTKKDKSEYFFTNICFWNMPSSDLDEYKVLWEKTRDTVRLGVKTHNKNGRQYNNLPSISDHRIGHVRPHAQDAKDVNPLPQGGFLTKHCFWLNNHYVKKIIEKNR